LAGEALSQWSVITKRLIVGEELPTEEHFTQALEEFGRVYLEATARRDQKWYLRQYYTELLIFCSSAQGHL